LLRLVLDQETVNVFEATVY